MENVNPLPPETIMMEAIKNRLVAYAIDVNNYIDLIPSPLKFSIRNYLL